MHSQNSLVGDQFMRQIEPIAAYLPYMVFLLNSFILFLFGNILNLPKNILFHINKILIDLPGCSRKS